MSALYHQKKSKSIIELLKLVAKEIGSLKDCKVTSLKSKKSNQIFLNFFFILFYLFFTI